MSMMMMMMIVQDSPSPPENLNRMAAIMKQLLENLKNP